MTTRPSLRRLSGHTSAHVQAPQRVSLDSHIIDSFIELPPNFCVAFSKLVPVSAQGYQDIDAARRRIFESNQGRPLKESLLTHAHLSRDAQVLWVFAILEKDDDTLVSRLNSLGLQGLTSACVDKFFPRDIYSCCTTCSTQRHQCSDCLAYSKLLHYYPHDQGAGSLDLPFSASADTATHLPRTMLRESCCFFFHAVQNRAINDLCQDAHRSDRIIRKFRDGFLCGFPNSSSEWGEGWEQHEGSRSLVFCRLDVTLLSSGLMLLPKFQATHLLPFMPTLPSLPGTPIHLLPFSTSAYFLNMYSGPTSKLVKQFQIYLTGLASGDLLYQRNGSKIMTDCGSGASAQFAIVWVSVQNKQGEEKGIVLVWPATLCLSIRSTTGAGGLSDRQFAYGRKPLPYIPELPITLQASPPPVPVLKPLHIVHVLSPQDSAISSSLFTPKAPLSGFHETSPSSFQTHVAESDLQPNVLETFVSFPRAAMHTYVSASAPYLPPRDIREVAVGVGKYVDSVVKERERERERIRKEREASSPGQGSKDLLLLRVPEPRNCDSSSASIPAQVASYYNDNLQVTATTTTGTIPHSMIFPHLQAVHTHLSAPQPAYPSPPDESNRQDQGTLSVQIHSPQLRLDDTQQASETYDSYAEDFIVDMSMNFGMTSASSSGGTGLSSATLKIDLDSYEIFTDDDFNFFDDNSKTGENECSSLRGQVPQQIPSATAAGDALGALDMASLSSSLFSAASKAGAPSSAAATWQSIRMTETNENKPQVALELDSVVAPELMSTSPDRSSSPSGPTTPNVPFSVENGDSGIHVLQAFSPVPFDHRILESDAKYANGKFAIVPLQETRPCFYPQSDVYWKTNYACVTDPRNGVVDRLIGEKRKLCIPEPDQEIHPSMQNTDEDDSDQDSDADRWSDGDDGIHTGQSSPISRPSTPLPSHLSLGPLLLPTQFLHSLVMPMSVNLRPIEAAFDVMDIPSPIANPVPTPVSPAAIANSSNESARALESLVRTLACEIVANAVWSEAWRASAFERLPFWNQESVEQLDSVFLTSVGSAWKSMSIGDAFNYMTHGVLGPPGGTCSLEPLEDPLFSVAKMGSVINIAPTAIRFWSQLGLNPRSGPKDVSTFVLFQDDEGAQEKANFCLERISSAYQNKGYGLHKRGSTQLYPVDGLIPVQLASIRKGLISILEFMKNSFNTTVIYIVTPISTLTLCSPILRQILSSIKRLLNDLKDSDKPVYFHFLPDFLLNSDDDLVFASILEEVADCVYNKIHRPTAKLATRPMNSLYATKLFEAPAFTLAQPLHATTSLFFQRSSANADSVNRYTLLHVGYRITENGKWLVAACIDQRGEAHDLQMWLLQDGRDFKQITAYVWEFALDFACRTSVEWRLAIARSGVMEEAELQEWNALLGDKLRGNMNIALTASILCVDVDAGWRVLPGRLPSNAASSVYEAPGKMSVLRTTAACYRLSGVLKCLLPPSRNINLDIELQNHIPEEDDTLTCSFARLRSVCTLVMINTSDPTQAPSMSTNTILIHFLQSIKSARSTYIKTIEESQVDICENYHELAVLTRARWHFRTNPNLPFHLAALHVVDSLLDLSNAVLSD